jgi:DNA-binding transcriptional ArsR family regulator
LSGDAFIIKDPEVAKLLADETRREILHLLRRQEMSASDLAKATDKNYSSISHHLNTLLNAGLIKVTREEKVRNMVQPYYRSVSHSFHVAYSLTEALSQDPDYSAWQEDYIGKLMKGLEAYNLIILNDKRAEVRNLLRTCYLREKKAYEEWIEQRVRPVEISGYASRNIAHILSSIQLMKDGEYMNAIDKLSMIFKEIKGDNRT